MLENLLRPWILARLLTAATAAVLIAVGAVAAIAILRHFREGDHGEAQIALERRGELVATAVQGAFFASLVGLFLTVAGSDRAAHSIRGAMCAYGVLDSTRWGFAALGASALSSLACGLWWVVHRLDLRLSTFALTRPKFALALGLAPFALADLALTSRYLFELDFGVVATCCSSSLDRFVTGDSTGAGQALLPFGASVALVSAAAMGSAFAASRPGFVVAFSAASLSLASLVVGSSSIVHHVAPHVHGTPAHRCPFCLLHLEALGIGWPLAAGLLAGVTFGLALPLLEALRARASADADVSSVALRIGRFSAFGWALVAFMMAAPVIHYRLLTGTTLLP